MDIVLTIASWVLLIGGGFFVISGSVGIIRMPDLFTRFHPAGITDSLGMPMMLLGVMLQTGLTLVTLKIVLLMVFLLLTSPTACHALAKAAISSGIKPVGVKTIQQDLPERISND